MLQECLAHSLNSTHKKKLQKGETLVVVCIIIFFSSGPWGEVRIETNNKKVGPSGLPNYYLKNLKFPTGYSAQYDRCSCWEIVDNVLYRSVLFVMLKAPWKMRRWRRKKRTGRSI